jgi:hypothetical protein
MAVEKQTHKSRTTPTALAQIASLPSLSIKELNAMWFKLYGAVPTVQRRAFLEGRLAYRIQELEYAQVNPSLLASNEARIEKLTEHLKPLLKAQKKKETFKLVPGTRLRRDFQGKTYEVNVQADGTFEYQGRPYTSLTAISQEITQQKWSGPAFFGLSRKSEAVMGGRR